MLANQFFRCPLPVGGGASKKLIFVDGFYEIQIITENATNYH